MDNSLKISRELFSAYSPLKTNLSLLKSYQNITNDYINIDNVRDVYNNLITKNFLNESVIKSAFIKRFLIKKSPRLNTTVFELNTGGSRADLCLMNGKSSVFEIKTEYDTYDRLSKQLQDYTDFFDKIFVIVPEGEQEIIKSNIPTHVGIIYYYQNRLGNVDFIVEREAIRNKLINPYKQLNSLTKSELSLLADTNVKSLSKDALIKILLEKHSSKYINQIYRETIKKKYYDKWNFLYDNVNSIYPLDFQWFFKNNIDYKIIYK